MNDAALTACRLCWPDLPVIKAKLAVESVTRRGRAQSVKFAVILGAGAGYGSLELIVTDPAAKGFFRRGQVFHFDFIGGD